MVEWMRGTLLALLLATIGAATSVTPASALSVPAVVSGLVPEAADATAPQAGLRKVQFFWPFSNNPPRRIWNRPNAPAPQPQAAPRGAPSAPSAPALPKGPAATVFGEVPAIDSATRVVVFGDSMAVGLADGLAAVFTEEKGFQVQRMTRPNSGIVRKDFFDWPAEIAKALDGQKIDIAIWMVGINDRQPIRLEGESHEPKTPRWTEIYQSRVDELVKLLQADGAAVYWVGLPIMRARRYGEDIAYINNAVRERVGLLGASYIDVWDAFAAADGSYSSDGPDINGERRRMRREDGIHFTDAGNEKLAHFIHQELEGDISLASLGPDGRRVIRQTPAGGLLVAPGSAAAAPDEDELAGAEAQVEVDTAARGGPAVALSAAPANEKADVEDTASPLFQVLMRGEALTPKPGRADDFSWPRD